jgi:hypothetical protein
VGMDQRSKPSQRKSSLWREHHSNLLKSLQQIVFSHLSIDLNSTNKNLSHCLIDCSRICYIFLGFSSSLSSDFPSLALNLSVWFIIQRFRRMCQLWT